MSNQPRGKRWKCGDGDEEAFGGPMYDEATARKMLQEAELIPAVYAEDGEAVIGFDPNDAALDNLYNFEDNTDVAEVTPLIYFARKGDAKMCRYLLSRGASPTTKMTPARTGPMYFAAQRGHLEVCKFLQANGASHDIWKVHPLSGGTPFHAAVYNGHDELVRWLVLEGALCAADASSEEIEEDRIYSNAYTSVIRNQMSRSCVRLVEWAKGVTQSHSALVTFFLGTQPRAPGKDQNRTLQCMSGQPGIRKHIGDFVGLEVTKGNQLRILRNVVDMLPSLIKAEDEE